MDVSDLLQSNESTLVLLRSSDLDLIAEKLVERYRAIQDKTESNPAERGPISQSEAMKILNRSRQCLVQWRKKGILKGFLIGGRVYFQPEEIASLQRIGRS